MTKEFLGEFIKGATDVPITALSAGFGLLLDKKYHKKKSAKLFLSLCIASALGAIAHMTKMRGVMLDIFWMVLYAFLFETVRCFAWLFTGHISGEEEKKDCRLVTVIELALLLCTIVFRFVLHGDEIYFLMAFCAAEAVRVGICVARFRPKGLGPLLTAIAAALVFQTFSAIIPYGVVLGHLSVWCAMYLLYRDMKYNYKE